MGHRQSKEELLYNQVLVGDIQAIKALHAEGAGLEWTDKEGKTPLTVACMNPELLIAAKTLIELGANINHYSPGVNAGTPLHHAAKRGLHWTVNLLLSFGANLFVRNDDRQKPLDIARTRGFNNVVRAIESHICLFSGWLREFYGPGFLEALAPQFMWRKIWVVILPCTARSSVNPPLKLEFVIFSTPKDPQPRAIIGLWKATIEEPNFHQRDPTLIIFDKSTKTRYRFASGTDGNRQQLQVLYDACKGYPQVTSQDVMDDDNTGTSVSAAAAAAAAAAELEAAELAMAINASIQSAAMEGSRLPPSVNPPSSSAHLLNANGWSNAAAENDQTHNGWGHQPSEAASTSANGWMDEPAREEYNGWGAPGNTSTNLPTNALSSSSVPSAPLVPETEDGPILYPSIDINLAEVASFTAPGQGRERGVWGESDGDGDGGSRSCIICWEAPVEGACIPCGHMAGCMSCLNNIKSDNGLCPVCRAHIAQLIKIYAV